MRLTRVRRRVSVMGDDLQKPLRSEQAGESPAAARRLDAEAAAIPLPDEPGPVEVEHESLDLVGILSAIEETAYVWDVAKGRIDWESNAKSVLGVSCLGEIDKASAYHMLIAPEHLTRRQAVASGSAAGGQRGIPYRIQYKFLPKGRDNNVNLWLEDHGQYWPGADGTPGRARGVVRVINDRFWEEQRLLHLSDHDELTGQLNRMRLTEALSATLSRADRSRQSCALLIAAINNLSIINETFGYHVGDELLAATARAMKSKLRGGDTLGRYSANKFGIILNDCGPGAMRIAAERFMKAVRNAIVQTSACQLSATISIGGVVVPDQAGSVDQALSNALQALDEAKQKRFDCFVAFEPNTLRETTRRRNISIADDVVTALDSNRMHLVLQPMVSTETGKPALYECLLRMEQPDGSIISAGHFITVAEQLGLSRLIDRRTLELAVDLVKKYPALKVSLNVSSLTASDHDWVVALHKLTGGRHDITNRLVIEITETAAIHDLDQTTAFVDTLRELGCKVAIDDFGAGYTSFKNLKALNVDMVKIDGAFVKNVCEDASDRVFIKTMIELSRSLGMETVAEWVGDADTARFLTDAGITYLQGYHYGQPLSEAALAQALEAA